MWFLWQSVCAHNCLQLSWKATNCLGDTTALIEGNQCNYFTHEFRNAHADVAVNVVCPAVMQRPKRGSGGPRLPRQPPTQTSSSSSSKYAESWMLHPLAEQYPFQRTANPPPHVRQQKKHVSNKSKSINFKFAKNALMAELHNSWDLSKNCQTTEQHFKIIWICGKYWIIKMFENCCPSAKWTNTLLKFHIEQMLKYIRETLEKQMPDQSTRNKLNNSRNLKHFLGQNY